MIYSDSHCQKASEVRAENNRCADRGIIIIPGPRLNDLYLWGEKGDTRTARTSGRKTDPRTNSAQRLSEKRPKAVIRADNH